MINNKFEIVSYEIGVLMAIAYNREDNDMKDSIEALALALDSKNIIIEKLKKGIFNEIDGLNTEESVTETAIKDILGEYEFIVKNK